MSALFFDLACQVTPVVLLTWNDLVRQPTVLVTNLIVLCRASRPVVPHKSSRTTSSSMLFLSSGPRVSVFRAILRDSLIAFNSSCFCDSLSCLCGALSCCCSCCCCVVVIDTRCWLGLGLYSGDCFDLRWSNPGRPSSLMRWSITSSSVMWFVEWIEERLVWLTRMRLLLLRFVRLFRLLLLRLFLLRGWLKQALQSN